MWTKSTNGEPVKLPEYEESGNYVILRKDFRLVEEIEERPIHYEWLEWQMTKDQYEIYKTVKAEAESKITPTESIFVASQNYTKDTVLTIDGTVYKAIRNIETGGKIVPYLNVVQVQLADIISNK